MDLKCGDCRFCCRTGLDDEGDDCSTGFICIHDKKLGDYCTEIDPEDEACEDFEED